MGDVGCVFERMPIVEDQVSDFAGLLQTSVAIVDLENFPASRVTEESAFSNPQPVNHGHACLVADDSRLRDVGLKTAADRDWDALA